MGEVVEFKKGWKGHEGVSLSQGQLYSLDAGSRVWVEGIREVEVEEVVRLQLAARTLVLGIVGVAHWDGGELACVVLLGSEGVMG